MVQDIEEADVYDVAIMSQLERAKLLSTKLGANIYVKREDLQPVHSFKIRGAYNKMRNLSNDQKSKGVLAASAGNHAQGVALSAKKLDIKATIVMPSTTPQIKIDAVKQYGAEVILYGDTYSDAADYAKKLQREHQLTYIHPFNDDEVIAGQGTVAVEILEQLPEVDYVFVPIGGGGLISGMAAYLKHHKPEVKIIGVEPEDSSAMSRSISADKLVSLKHVGIFADGVAVKQVGENTFGLVKKFVDEFMTVSTDEICSAIKDIYQDTRVIVEPSGALSVAGLQRYRQSHPELVGKHIVTVNSGANMTFEQLQFIAERTLIGSGNESLYSIELPERPRALKGLIDNTINGLSISEFNYRKSDNEKANIFVGIVYKNKTEKDKFESRLSEQGYKMVDLSNDDIAKTHIKHMIGGKPPAGTKEQIYDFEFPERPGALSDFLNSLDEGINISLFHYRYTGGDRSRVLMGLETDRELKQSSLPSGFILKKAASTSVKLFL